MSDIAFIGQGQSDAGLTASDVGNKAANLARLDALGLRVPPAVAIDLQACREFFATGRAPDGFAAALGAALRRIEQATGCTLGGRVPLLLSVRSSPPASMPGMLESVLNVGLSVQTVPGLIRRTGNPWLAWDALRRGIRSYGEVVCGLEPALCDELEGRHLKSAGARSLDELDPLALRDLARALSEFIATQRPDTWTSDPFAQVAAAVEAVWRSWNAPKAQAYRRMNGIADGSGTGVLIQAMVFGNAGPRSGSGVGFTRNPATGDDELYLDFVFNAQGEDVVAGRTSIADSALLPHVLPQVFADLQAARPLLESAFLDMQDFEFTVDEGQLYFLQTRDGKRTAWAALQMAVDLVRAGVIDRRTALERLAAYDLDMICRTGVRPDARTVCLAAGTGAAPGVASGAVVVSAARAQQVATTTPVILVRPDVTTDDFPGLAASAGMLTAVGGRTSHAAVVARQLGRPCVVGCAALRVDEASRSCVLGERTCREGDVITIDGETGCVYGGLVPVVTERPVALLEEVGRWREAVVG